MTEQAGMTRDAVGGEERIVGWGRETSGPDGWRDDSTLLTAKTTGEPVDDATFAARRVIDALLRTAHDNPGLPGIARSLHEIAAELEEHSKPGRERIRDMWAGGGIARHDPVTGPENAIAPPLEVHAAEDGWVEGRVTLGLPYQGPPACVHGGISALLLDHVLGVANHHGGKTGVTATLTLTYRRPTPLFTELRIRARQMNVEGRKITSHAEILADDRVCVEADGLFVVVDDSWHIRNAVEH